MGRDITPQRILDLSGGFMPALVVLTANKLGLFSELAKGPLNAENLRKRLGLHEEDCSGWMLEAGFRKTYREHLTGPKSMVVGIK